MYLSMEEAVLTLEKRWRNLELRNRLEVFLGDLPTVLKSQPRAMIARPMATPNYEQRFFLEQTASLGLPPLILEYPGDKMCTWNQDKSALLKLNFNHGLSGKGNFVRNGTALTIPAAWEGQPLNQIITDSGENLVDLHHRLMQVDRPEVEREDQTSWLQAHGGQPRGYYPYFLGLFICHGILFESFLSKGGEAGFTASVVTPTLKLLEQKFRLTPLIVRLLPDGEEKDKRWNRYPGYLQGHL